MKIKLVILLLITAALQRVWAQQKSDFSTDLRTTEKPWSHLNFENNPDNFQFAIVTDRTGGARPGIFEDAVKKLNWLLPEFVISVGDLIQGASGKDSVELEKQWAEHFERIKPLKMPFFHLAGNHDIKADNQFQIDYWNRMFGAPFYSFVYKNVLFLCMFSNEGFQYISNLQIEYFEKVLQQHQDVRWTMVLMHHPLWRYPHESNFDKVEELLNDRNYTVYAGHQHRYHHSVRKESNYYVLATTGGGSGLLGNNFGQFDHFAWITMSDNGPIMANLRLDGILPHDVSNEQTSSLARSLVDAVFYDQQVMVDQKDDLFQQGIAYLSFNNTSHEPIFLSGRFFHNHQVTVNPIKLDVEIPPASQKVIELNMQAIKPFDVHENVLLEFEATLSYDPEEYPGFQISGKKTIQVKPSKIELLASEEVEFKEEYTVNIDQPIENSSLYYTLDGSNPDENSNRYVQSFQINQEATVKATLINQEKMKSPVDAMHLKPVTNREGLLCHFYEKNESWFEVPNFKEIQPKWIKKVKKIDIIGSLSEVSDWKETKREHFGLKYQSNITLPEDGKYVFSMSSDDGARLLIDGKEAVADPVKHKPRLITNEVIMKKGTYPLELHFFQHRKGMLLDLSFTTPSGKQVNAKDWQLNL